ncbi:unnamed protein product [Amoebophrya sp. A25]|nr:unnamed protein product [Amoebophrya sp. A25]|eukprot:GSA25T00009359001.1
MIAAWRTSTSTATEQGNFAWWPVREAVSKLKSLSNPGLLRVTFPTLFETERRKGTQTRMRRNEGRKVHSSDATSSIDIVLLHDKISHLLSYHLSRCNGPAPMPQR